MTIRPGEHDSDESFNKTAKLLECVARGGCMNRGVSHPGLADNATLVTPPPTLALYTEEEFYNPASLNGTGRYIRNVSEYQSRSSRPPVDSNYDALLCMPSSV